jgi:hypothetical protein
MQLTWRRPEPWSPWATVSQISRLCRTGRYKPDSADERRTADPARQVRRRLVTDCDEVDLPAEDLKSGPCPRVRLAGGKLGTR